MHETTNVWSYDRFLSKNLILILNFLIIILSNPAAGADMGADRTPCPPLGNTPHLDNNVTFLISLLWLHAIMVSIRHQVILLKLCMNAWVTQKTLTRKPCSQTEIKCSLADTINNFKPLDRCWGRVSWAGRWSSQFTRPVYVPILPYGHKLWVLTERMSFQGRMAQLSLSQG